MESARRPSQSESRPSLSESHVRKMATGTGESPGSEVGEVRQAGGAPGGHGAADVDHGAVVHVAEGVAVGLRVHRGDELPGREDPSEELAAGVLAGSRRAELDGGLELGGLLVEGPDRAPERIA